MFIYYHNAMFYRTVLRDPKARQSSGHGRCLREVTGDNSQRRRPYREANKEPGSAWTRGGHKEGSGTELKSNAIEVVTGQVH